MVWTKKEIEEYQRIRIKEMGPFYLLAGIEKTNPEKRLEFLINWAIKNGKGILDYPSIINKEEKVKTLNILETRILERFKNYF